ncbi:MAG: YbhB/YbcL family Raf kinase inhibitor-like protein [Anaerolineae bacterium]|nr:YbhB/YbcL family Raf kinase inhibitor-like protein [Anaerolineae bacterium]
MTRLARRATPDSASRSALSQPRSWVPLVPPARTPLPPPTLDPGAAAVAPDTIRLFSPDFPPDGPLPVACTCDGAGESPPLAWGGLPAGTAALALICETADAPHGSLAHWVLYNLPAAARELPRALPPGSTPGGSRQGMNDFGAPGYTGACPPPGENYRYIFTLYALDSPLPLPPGASRTAVSEAMRGHVLATGRLMATYRRRPAPPPR